MNVRSAVSKVDNQQGPTIQSVELCSVSCGRLLGREVSGGMDPCICMAESLCCSPEIIRTLFINYTPIQTKKF